MYSPSSLSAYFRTQNVLKFEANEPFILHKIDEWDAPGISSVGMTCMQELRVAILSEEGGRREAIADAITKIFRFALMLLSKSLESLSTEGGLQISADPEEPLLEVVSDKPIIFKTCPTNICARFEDIFYRLYRCQEVLVLPSGKKIYIIGSDAATMQDILRRKDGHAISALINKAAPIGTKGSLYTVGDLDIEQIEIIFGSRQQESVDAFGLSASRNLIFIPNVTQKLAFGCVKALGLNRSQVAPYF